MTNDPDIEAHKWRQRYAELWEFLENGNVDLPFDSEKFEDYYLEL